jgi:hypothetical protein
MPKQRQKAERDFKTPMNRYQLWAVLKYLGHDASTPEAAVFVDRNADLLMEHGGTASAIATGLDTIRKELAESQSKT